MQHSEEEGLYLLMRAESLFPEYLNSSHSETGLLTPLLNPTTDEGDQTTTTGLESSQGQCVTWEEHQVLGQINALPARKQDGDLVWIPKHICYKHEPHFLGATSTLVLLMQQFQKLFAAT